MLEKLIKDMKKHNFSFTVNRRNAIQITKSQKIEQRRTTYTGVVKYELLFFDKDRKICKNIVSWEWSDKGLILIPDLTFPNNKPICLFNNEGEKNMNNYRFKGVFTRRDGGSSTISFIISAYDHDSAEKKLHERVKEILKENKSLYTGEVRF